GRQGCNAPGDGLDQTSIELLGRCVVVRFRQQFEEAGDRVLGTSVEMRYRYPVESSLVHNHPNRVTPTIGISAREFVAEVGDAEPRGDACDAVEVPSHDRAGCPVE